MSNSKNIRVSDTAFVTCAFRRLDEELSGDYYAKLWNNENAEKILKGYINYVSKEEIETHCIRNRYFLETIKNLVKNNEIEILINFGAGFSMYPFLLDSDISHIEIDKPEVVEYKKEVITKLISQNKLPKRDLTYVGVDFSQDYLDKLLTNLKQIVDNRSCFILIEGVLFFLNKSETILIFSLFDKLQNTNDYIGSVSYTEDARETSAFSRLIEYTNRGLKDASADGCQIVPNSFYESLESYRLINKEDYFSCSKLYNHKPKLDADDILNESFYILKKTIS
ncbi:MAG: adenosine deaminase [Winogradskyella sp.]|uniref:class I SAM-dependent methyltransferase n=1 Tax=Winogradskyella sp. TaxID=1883156 RepID=UPI0017CD4FBC|nr:class I SAM-dependent methyltransferase [Winogradskyella sp.]MBT8243772.1 class I SAM-dependent methyltransferase [Winogradskyella sp.]NNK22036.1 adenosine deaminase [Winogradskyella sp.]